MKDNFIENFQAIFEKISHIVRDWTKIADKSSYLSLIECLTLHDSIAVGEAIDAIVSEGNQVAIPPLYLVSHKHPSHSVRKKAYEACKILDKDNNISKIDERAPLSSSMERLLEVFGNFRYDR